MKYDPVSHLIEDEETKMPTQNHIPLPLNHLHETLIDDDDSYKHKMKDQSKTNLPSAGIQLELKHALNQFYQSKLILLDYLMKIQEHIKSITITVKTT